MSAIERHHRRARESVRSFLRNLESKPRDERLKALEEELNERLVEQQLLHVESMEALSGSWSRDVDARSLGHDDLVDEAEIVRQAHRDLTMHDLETARDVCRALKKENEFAIGCHNSRVNYTVGTGLRWALVPIDAASESLSEKTQVVGALQRFLAECDPDGFHEVCKESVWRADRDGESFLDLRSPVSDSRKPLQVRFREPEDLVDSKEAPWGIETVPEDVRDIIGYHFGDDVRPPLLSFALEGVVHVKLNVELNARRGWPTLFPARHPLRRAENLMRNMSYVAALQAAIALIRKHDKATRAEVEGALRRNQDLLLRQPGAAARDVGYTKLPPGSTIDAGAGTTYEAPVSSVNASNNVMIVDAELRTAATSVNQPEFMFSGNAAGAAYASALVAEGPVAKAFQALQVLHGERKKRIVEAGLRYEQSVGRIAPGVLERYQLVVSYPPVTVRDQLQEEQRRQIQRSAGALSIQTWRSQIGLDDATEERNLTIEQARGYGPRPGGAVPNGATNKPAGTPGAPALDPGGAAKADPKNPQTARAEL